MQDASQEAKADAPFEPNYCPPVIDFARIMSGKRREGSREMTKKGRRTKEGKRTGASMKPEQNTFRPSPFAYLLEVLYPDTIPRRFRHPFH